MKKMAWVKEGRMILVVGLGGRSCLCQQAIIISIIDHTFSAVLTYGSSVVQLLEG